MPREQKSKPDHQLDPFDICNASSVTDCTGLIQIPPQSEAELESYREIYNFAPPAPVSSYQKDKLPQK